jgi:uracil permease
MKMNQNNKPVLDINEVPGFGQWVSLSIQHLFAMFGATVLVPVLVGLSPAVALVSSGVATLAFILITKGKVPSYLGSSFAFIAPIIAIKATGGPEAAMVGGILVGIIYALVALVIKFAGYDFIQKLLPPIVVGPVIMVIGLGLAGVAVDMAMNVGGKYSLEHFSAALVTLAITIIANVFGRGFVAIVPILIGIIGGYLYSMAIGIVNFDIVRDAKWFAAPDFMVPFAHYTPELTWKIALIMVPVTIVTISEHIGHQLVLGRVINKDMIKDPGLDRSLFADGVASAVASGLGGVPITTYGENIGVLALTRAYSIYLFVGASIFAIIFGFIGKVSAFISSIPTPVMGGVSILLFGVIASSGLRMLVEDKVNMADKRNLIISSVILVVGIGGAILKISENFEIAGMALAAILGVILNKVLPESKNISSDETASTSENVA